ncbi:hypothetical protein CASFOL_025754 [Castilleja foliolosa]|uniref:Uncharacterized protein n=1 Tax=Castilleja foliolosa TaxID=1961234 RepID=A0ABD3CVS8_9LAMI
MSTEQKRVPSPDALAGEILSPKRIRTDDDDASLVDVDSDFASTSPQAIEDKPAVISAYTSGIPQDFMIDELVDSRSIGILASEASKDGEIAQILDQFLQTLDFDSPHTLQTRALELNHQAKNIWENHRFIGVLLKTLLPCSMRRFNLVASRKLTEFIMRKIKSDPSFKDVFKYSEPDSLMRSALSIWIGYWSNDYMTFLLVDLMGRRALGLNYYVDVSEDVVNDEKTHLASGAFPAVEEDMIVCSPLIADLRQDESIKTLAKQLIENPVAVKLAEELLMSLQDDVPVGRDDHYKYHMRHKKVVFKFWCDPFIVLQLSKALKESVHLVNIFKKCSKRAQFLRCAERFTRIQRDPLLVPILRGDPNHKMRGAVSILFGYCSEVDLSMLVCAIFGAQEENDAFSEFDETEDKVELFSYLSVGPDDVEGLKNVLADKYREDSVEYMDRLLKLELIKRRKSLFRRVRSLSLPP